MLRMIPRITTTRDIVHSFVPRYARGRTLDVGAGTAKYRSFIQKHVDEYITSDLMPESGADIIEDASHMTSPNDTYDTILSFQVLEHVRDPQAVAAEMFRVLKPGGMVIATAPFLIQEHADPSDYHRYTRHGFRALFERAGLQVVEVGAYGGLGAVIGEYIKFSYLNPYRPSRSRLVRFLARRLVRACVALDARGYAQNDDVYANVYAIAHK